MAALRYCASTAYVDAAQNDRVRLASSVPARRRRELILSGGASLISISAVPFPFPSSASSSSTSIFSELPDSGGVKALDLRIGSGENPVDNDQVAIHYYGRLAAKQGWRFDSTYDHKDASGEPIPFVFQLGSGKVISGIEVAVKSMKVGGIRRVVIPPSQGYQNTTQEPLPPDVWKGTFHLSDQIFTSSLLKQNLPLDHWSAETDLFLVWYAMFYSRSYC